MEIRDRLKQHLERMDSPVASDLLRSTKVDKGNFLDYNTGFLTYTPTKNLEVKDVYNPKYRVRGRPAKIAKNFCMEDHTDKEYEEFYNSLIGMIFTVSNLEIVRGKDITRAYLSEIDTRKQSAMLKSCMYNENGNSRSFKFYEDNPEVVRLLVLRDIAEGDKKPVVLGRALIWKTDKGVYLDRIYGSEPVINFIKMYADTKGWLRYRSETSLPVMKVTVNHRSTYPTMPYLDSFDGLYYNTGSETMYLTT